MFAVDWNACLIKKLFTYSGGTGQGISLSGPISPTTLSLLANQKMAATPLVAASVQPTAHQVSAQSLLASAVPTNSAAALSVGSGQLVLPPVSTVVTSAPYRLPLNGASTAGPSQFIAATIDENINYDLISPMLATSNGGHTEDRYFQCEPMDATVGPVELTNNPASTESQQSGPGAQSTAGSNPGTPLDK